MRHFFEQLQRCDRGERGFTRRDFGRIAALLTAGASLPFFNEAALAQDIKAIASIPGANIPGKPSECAYGSSRWRRLKSPDDDAYRTICTRSMAGLVSGGRSSPTRSSLQ